MNLLLVQENINHLVVEDKLKPVIKYRTRIKEKIIHRTKIKPVEKIKYRTRTVEKIKKQIVRVPVKTKAVAPKAQEKAPISKPEMHKFLKYLMIMYLIY